MSNNRLLTWGPNYKRSGGRWRKQVDGKVHYFGAGRNEKDNKAYRAAQKTYLDFLQQREKTKPITVELDKATIADVVEKYLQHEHNRYTRGEISAVYFDKTRNYILPFVTWVGSETSFNDIHELLLADYRSHILTFPISAKTDKPISSSTAKEHLRQIKALYTWAYEMYICEKLPRNLRKYNQVPNANGQTIKTFSIDELKTLWNNADSRLQCYMALALNCGMGQKDISDLKYNEVDWANGYIIRERSKTKIMSKHKLWDVTLQLLQEHRNPKANGDDRILLNNNGNPLVSRTIKDGKLKQSNAISNLFWRLLSRVNINEGRSFYSLRKSGATLVEKIDPLATEMFLAHTERGMKRAYAQRDWNRLEQALEKMEKMLGLKL